MAHTSRMTRGRLGHSLEASGAVFWRVASVFVLLLTIFSATQSQVSAASDGYVETDVLYLRSDPSTDANVTSEMYYGDYVAVIDGPTEHGWYFVDYSGIQGWAHGKYLSFDGPPRGGDGSEAVGSAGAAVWVDTDVLNVRAAPRSDSWVMGSVSQGEELWVVGERDNGFYPVAYGSDTGWVAGRYLSWEPVGGGGGGERWVIVDRSSSTVNLMVGNEVIGTYWAAMGIDTSDDGFYATALGTYYVYEMNAELTWTDWAKGYITYWVAFDPDRYNGFHGYTMDKLGEVIEGGDGPTGGCVALDPYFASVLFDFVSIGTRVEVRW